MKFSSILEEHGLGYVTDISNESDAFLRNAIRMKVLPVMRDCDERFDKTFEKTHAHIQATDEFIQKLTQKTFTEITLVCNEELQLSVVRFFDCDPFLHHGLLVMWLCKAQVPFTPSTGFFDELVRFLQNDGLQHQSGENWVIVKNANFAVIKKIGQ